MYGKDLINWLIQSH